MQWLPVYRILSILYMFLKRKEDRRDSKYFKQFGLCIYCMNMRKSIEILIPPSNNSLLGHFVPGDIVLLSIYTTSNISLLCCYYQKEVNIAQLALKCPSNCFRARSWKASSDRYDNWTRSESSRCIIDTQVLQGLAVCTSALTLSDKPRKVLTYLFKPSK